MPAPVSGLRTTEYELGDLAMVWWLGKHAPWSEQVGTDSLAVLAGHAIDDAGNWLGAAQLRERWTAERDGAPSVPPDGYHLGIVYEAGRNLTIAADLLGFFPVYCWNQAGVVLVASSSKLLTAHPAFVVKPSLEGIVGMLMINGLVANQALLTGVRRLSPGHRLICEQASERGNYVAREQLQYRVAGSNRFDKASLAELVEIADAAMRRVVKRHTPVGVQTTQLVSGGLDSRLVTGYLKEANIACTGICLGQPYDFEAQAALAAADILRFPVQLVEQEMSPAGFVEEAKRRVQWLQLSAGTGCGELADAHAALQASAPCFWSGISLDDVLGGGWLGYGYDAAAGSWTFQQFAKDAAKWGLSPERLVRLVRKQGGEEVVETVLQAFEREFNRHEDAPHRLVFHARTGNRHRYHLGNTVWQLSFSSWPLLFMTDREWLETMVSLPPAMAMKKRLEMELLRQKFPQLLAAPVDVNSWHHGWINPSRTYKLRQRLNKIVPVERVWHDWYWRRWRGTDRRRYWRFYDFDGPKWRAVRQAAEPLRERLEAWFDRDKVDRLLPAPQAKLPKNNAFGDPASRRNLLGLALWEEHA